MTGIEQCSSRGVVRKWTSIIAKIFLPIRKLMEVTLRSELLTSLPDSYILTSEATSPAFATMFWSAIGSWELMDWNRKSPESASKSGWDFWAGSSQFCRLVWSVRTARRDTNCMDRTRTPDIQVVTSWPWFHDYLFVFSSGNPRDLSVTWCLAHNWSIMLASDPRRVVRVRDRLKLAHVLISAFDGLLTFLNLP